MALDLYFLEPDSLQNQRNWYSSLGQLLQCISDEDIWVMLRINLIHYFFKCISLLFFPKISATTMQITKLSQWFYNSAEKSSLC